MPFNLDRSPAENEKSSNTPQIMNDVIDDNWHLANGNSNNSVCKCYLVHNSTFSPYEIQQEYHQIRTQVRCIRPYQLIECYRRPLHPSHTIFSTQCNFFNRKYPTRANASFEWMTTSLSSITIRFRNIAQSSTNVSNSPPSPHTLSPYLRCIAFKWSAMAGSASPRWISGSSPNAATLMMIASTPAVIISSSSCDCSRCHR